MQGAYLIWRHSLSMPQINGMGLQDWKRMLKNWIHKLSYLSQTLELTAFYSPGGSEVLFWGLWLFACFVLLHHHTGSYQMRVNEKSDWELVRRIWKVLSNWSLKKWSREELCLTCARLNPFNSLSRGRRGKREGGGRKIDRLRNPWEVLLCKCHHLTSSCF